MSTLMTLHSIIFLTFKGKAQSQNQGAVCHTHTHTTTSLIHISNEVKPSVLIEEHGAGQMQQGKPKTAEN